MEQNDSLNILNTIISPSMALVGVIIGIVFSPIAAYAIEKIKIKTSLRPELIKTIYVFFNLRKVTIELVNANAMKSQASKFIWDKLRNKSLPEVERNELDRQFNVYNSAIQNNNQNLNSYFKMLIEMESNIYSILALIQVHYGRTKYNKLHTFISPYVDRSNTSQFFFDYKKMSVDEHSEAQEAFQNKLLTKFDELNKDCGRVINLITVTL